MSSITIEIEILGNEVEVEVKYSWFGTDRPATQIDPAEYAELEISSITRVVEGSEIEVSGMFTNEEHDKIIVTLQEWLNEGEY